MSAMLEREAKRRGMTVTELTDDVNATPDALVRDIVADARKGISKSQSMITARPEAEPTRRSNRGWVEPEATSTSTRGRVD